MGFPLTRRIRSRLTGLGGVGLAALLLSGAARADGTFLQFDIAPTAEDGVAAVTRGRVNYGLTHAAYDGGSTLGASLTYSFPIADAGTIKIGPSLSRTLDDDGDAETGIGAKISYDRYIVTEGGFVYLLGEYNTIDNNWFATVQFGLPAAVTLELSAGGSDNYEAATVGLSKRIGTGPVSLRAGYKLLAEEVYVGVSINTF